MTNLKPFSLPEALAGKAVMLRDGRKAFVRYHETEFCKEEDMRIVGILPDGIWLAWCESGDYYSPVKDSASDIIGMYPETRVINGFEVPAPETERLEFGARYYLATPADRDFYRGELWNAKAMDEYWLERGIVFLNKEDAIATAKAMLGIDPYSETES